MTGSVVNLAAYRRKKRRALAYRGLCYLGLPILPPLIGFCLFMQFTADMVIRRNPIGRGVARYIQDVDKLTTELLNRYPF